MLDSRLTAEGLRAEAAYLRANPAFERMYGWGWALRLALELRTWDDPQAEEWAGRFAPVELAVVANSRRHLAELTWPIRCGFHPETSFPLGQMLDYGRVAADTGFRDMVLGKCREFYGEDRDYPVAYEPSGSDFFSAGLNEADLMRRVLSGSEFDRWLAGFFPGLADGRLGGLLEPVTPRNLADPQLVHLVGLNLSRAWTMRSVALSLASDDDPRRRVLLDAAGRHAEAGLRDVFSGRYEGEHWLGSFAVYLLTGAGLPEPGC